MKVIPPDFNSLDRSIDALEEADSVYTKRRRWLKGLSLTALGVFGAGGSYYYWTLPSQPSLRFDGRYAYAGPELPPVVHAIVRYANEIQGHPYQMGGGHQTLFDDTFDCSGAVSHVLFRAGCLRGPLTSAGFARFGQPGPGQYVTLFIKQGSHVFMSICGLRFDTSGGQQGEGPRWRPQPRNPNGFIVRHPEDL
jgi:hypothetical protein